MRLQKNIWGIYFYGEANWRKTVKWLFTSDRYQHFWKGKNHFPFNLIAKSGERNSIQFIELVWSSNKEFKLSLPKDLSAVSNDSSSTCPKVCRNSDWNFSILWNSPFFLLSFLFPFFQHPKFFFAWKRFKFQPELQTTVFILFIFVGLCFFIFIQFKSYATQLQCRPPFVGWL